MKKLLSIAVIVALCLALAACGSKNAETAQETTPAASPAATTEPVTEPQNAAPPEVEAPEPEVQKEPVSLVGTWADAKSDIHVAVIDEDTISIYWTSDSGYQLYWTGSYEVPEVYTEEFSWESVNFHDITDYALYASSADTKEFSYKDGAIVYQGSLQGETFTVNLTPARVIGIETKKPGSAANALAEKLPLELVDSGYSVYKSSSYINLPYTVVIHNPNEGFAVEFPTIIVTARDDGGAILSNEEQVLSYVAAGDTVTYSNYAFWEGSVIPASVDISVKTGKNDYAVQSSKFITSDSFEFKNVTVKKGRWDLKVTGEVTNLSENDMNMVEISVNFLKDGKYIGGDSSYIDDIYAGETSVFEISVYCGIDDYDDVVMSGSEW